MGHPLLPVSPYLLISLSPYSIRNSCVCNPVIIPWCGWGKQAVENRVENSSSPTESALQQVTTLQLKFVHLESLLPTPQELHHLTALESTGFPASLDAFLKKMENPATRTSFSADSAKYCQPQPHRTVAHCYPQPQPHCSALLPPTPTAL